MKGLETSFSSCVRAAAGFCSLVPASVAHKFCGFDKLRDYLKYWFGSRSTDAYLKDNFDVYSKFLEEKKSLVGRPGSKYNMRNSTRQSSETSWSTTSSIFPESAKVWLEGLELVRKDGILCFGRLGRNYKIALKKKYVSCLIHKNTLIENAVAKINDEWVQKIIHV